eukprot:2269420-Pyramimonas_sp.AAC.1
MAYLRTNQLPKFEKLTCFFNDLGTRAPVLAQAGANESYGQGIEVKMVKEAITTDWSIFKGKAVYVHAMKANDNPDDLPTADENVKWQLYDEYVVHASTLLFISAKTFPSGHAEIEPPSSVSESSVGVSKRAYLTYEIKVQGNDQWLTVSVPNVAEGPPHQKGVKVITVKKCILSTLALPAGRANVNDIRLYRNHG